LPKINASNIAPIADTTHPPSAKDPRGASCAGNIKAPDPTWLAITKDITGNKPIFGELELDISFNIS
jgi:hypothetical protein